MKILVVEDNASKRMQIEEFLKTKGVKFETIGYVEPALKYIAENQNDISGIILDLSLKTDENSNDYHPKKGLVISEELNKRKIDIPIMLNSETLMPTLFLSRNIYSQRRGMNDYRTLEEFLVFLKEKQEQ